MKDAAKLTTTKSKVPCESIPRNSGNWIVWIASIAQMCSPSVKYVASIPFLAFKAGLNRKAGVDCLHFAGCAATSQPPPVVLGFSRLRNSFTSTT